MGEDSTSSVVIERTLDAPIGLVWSMWTRPDHFSAWYGPTGASITIAEMDVRVGGRRFVEMQMGAPSNPTRMWFTGEYREIDEPVRLVYTETLADETGDALPPSQLPDGHPAVTEITVELEAIGDRTRMVMTHAGVPADSPGAAGWRMAFDSLERYVASRIGS